MNNDLDTPRSLAVFFEWMKATNKKIKSGLIEDRELQEARNFLIVFDAIFGLLRKSKMVIPDKIQVLLDARSKARMSKDWSSSDAIRDEIIQVGR